MGSEKAEFGQEGVGFGDNSGLAWVVFACDDVYKGTVEVGKSEVDHWFVLARPSLLGDLDGTTRHLVAARVDSAIVRDLGHLVTLAIV